MSGFESETIEITIDSIVYLMAKEISGFEYAEIRRKSVKQVLVTQENGSSKGNLDLPPDIEVVSDSPTLPRFKTEIDAETYDLWNLFSRLKQPGFSSPEEMIKSLPRKHHQVLVLLAGRLDNDEAGGIADFLRANTGLFRALPSTSEVFSDSPQPISGASSE